MKINEKLFANVHAGFRVAFQHVGMLPLTWDSIRLTFAKYLESATRFRSHGEAWRYQGLAAASAKSMAKQLPVIPADIVCTVEALLSVGDVPIEGWVWPQSARRQEAAGKLRAIADSSGSVVAWQRVREVALMRGESKAPECRSASMPILARSSCSISSSEMNAYAGRHFKGGGSRTAGMTEEEREKQTFPDRPLTEAEILAGKRQRFGKPPAEDFMERLVAKVDAFEPCGARA